MQNTYLVHHGVKGMKWGVRNDKRRSAIGTSARVGEKIDMFNKKIAKSDHNVIARNTINDYRRGRVAALKLKQANRAAKENYRAKKTKVNAENLDVSRMNRVRNVARPAFGVGIVTRGSYNRYRSNGDSFVKSTAKAATKSIAVGAAVGMGYNFVMSQGMNALMKSRF